MVGINLDYLTLGSMVVIGVLILVLVILIIIFK